MTSDLPGVNSFHVVGLGLSYQVFTSLSGKQCRSASGFHWLGNCMAATPFASGHSGFWLVCGGATLVVWSFDDVDSGLGGDGGP
jgi:hypothetical protein